jgi:hypothetical protein
MPNSSRIDIFIAKLNDKILSLEDSLDIKFRWIKNHFELIVAALKQLYIKVEPFSVV